METKQFDSIVDHRIAQIKRTLSYKAKEYAFDNDRLWNFKQAAKLSNSTQHQALWGIALKHLVSVVDLIEGRLPPEPALINEKVGDMINYLILLEATLLEKDSMEESKLGSLVPPEGMLE